MGSFQFPGLVSFVRRLLTVVVAILALMTAGNAYAQADSALSGSDTGTARRQAPVLPKPQGLPGPKVQPMTAEGAALALSGPLVLDSLFITDYAEKQVAIPYYESWQNPWYLYSGRYQQFIDVLRPTDLMVSRILALTHRPGNQPYEQGKVYFPGPTCVYLDGRFLAFIEDQVLDLNKLTPHFNHYLAFYLNPSYQELAARRGETDLVKAGPVNGRPPYRQNRDALLAGGFTLMLALLLGTRGRAFYRIFSLRSLLLQPEQALPGQGPEVLGPQTAIHLAITVVCTAIFLYCYRYGVDPVLLRFGPGNGSGNLMALGELAAGVGAYMVGLAVYVYVIGLSLFNIRMEGSHVRGNLEVFSIGALVLGLWGLLWNFTGLVGFNVFRTVSVYFCLIIFGVKGFLMYKILVSDQGFRKFYALSYICLTELLPSIFLIRLLTDL